MKKFLIALLAFYSIGSTASETIYVPSDPSAKYIAIQNKRIDNLSILQTIRRGSSGVSFSSRLCNCSNNTYKYLADVDGEENMDIFLAKNNAAMDSLDEFNMSPLVHGSISYYACKYSCK